MKKFLIFIALAVMPLTVLAQAQIDTKKVKIGDFTQKITKVVLTGGAMFDGVLQEEIAARWRVSPYEFCTLEEFNSLKDNDNYYFLLATKGQFKRETEPSLQFLTLIKGGKNASEGIDEMLEIVSLPICAADDPSGRELIFLPVFLTIIQEYALDSMDKDYNAYGGLGNYTSNITKSSDMKIVFSEDDINSSVPESEYADFCITDEDTADLYITNNTPGFLVSYVVAPAEPVNGSFCYKMLIDAQTYKLYYFRKHRITPKAGAGFMSFDLRNINSARVNHR